MKNGLLSRKNLANALIILALAIIVFVPPAKALLIRGLMRVGFFSADVGLPTKKINAPDVIVQDISGKATALSQLKGKVVVINIWATWCPPCLAELPSLNSLHKRFNNNPGVTFLAIDADSELDRSVKFMADKGYDLPVYKTGDLPPQIFTGTLPTTLIIDKAGQIVFRHEGIANYGSDAVEAFVRKLSVQ